MDKAAYLADEELIIRDGGEMPEVTLHGSIYYLTEDPEGPKLTLKEADIHSLKKAVIHCYLRIILRDLQPENRDLGLYRGLERCRVNWQRLSRYGVAEGLSLEQARHSVVAALSDFMEREVMEVQRGERSSCINCSSEALTALLEDLKMDADTLPQGWQHICL